MARKRIYRKNSSNGLDDTDLVIPTSSDLAKLDSIESGAQKNPTLAAVAISGDYNSLSNKPDLNAKADNHRHFKSGDSQRNAGVYTYYKLASFPIDNGCNSCSLTVDGRIGGWNNGNKGYLSMVISNRDGVAASGTLIGNADLSLCDLVVYTSGTASANSTAILYVKTYSWFAFDLTLGPMSGAADIWDGQGTNTTPEGTLAWSLSENANKFLQIRDNGDINAGADLNVTGDVQVGGKLTVGSKTEVALKTDVPDVLGTLNSLPSNQEITWQVKDSVGFHFGGLNWYGLSDSAQLFAAGTSEDNLDLVLRLGDDGSNKFRIWNKDDATVAEMGANGDISCIGDMSVGGSLKVKGKAVLTDHQSIKMLNTTNAVHNSPANESITGSGTIYLHQVAKTGSYNDLLDKPIFPYVYNGKLTIKKNGLSVASFTANSSSDVAANITVPTKLSELENDIRYVAGVEDVMNEHLIITSIYLDKTTKKLNVINARVFTPEYRKGSYGADNSSDHMLLSINPTSQGSIGCIIMVHGHITSESGYINITDTATVYTDYDSYAVQAGQEGYWSKSWVTATAFFVSGTAYIHAKGAESIWVRYIYF